MVSGISTDGAGANASFSHSLVLLPNPPLVADCRLTHLLFSVLLNKGAHWIKMLVVKVLFVKAFADQDCWIENVVNQGCSEKSFETIVWVKTVSRCRWAKASFNSS
jgi:hypothetical protein